MWKIVLASAALVSFASATSLVDSVKEIGLEFKEEFLKLTENTLQNFTDKYYTKNFDIDASEGLKQWNVADNLTAIVEKIIPLLPFIKFKIQTSKVYEKKAENGIVVQTGYIVYNQDILKNTKLGDVILKFKQNWVEDSGALKIQHMEIARVNEVFFTAYEKVLKKAKKILNK